MPNALQTLDTSFPKIDNHQTTQENFLQVTNYLYMLLENLRYTLGNLGVENINATEMDSIAQLIREPVWARIEDTEGNVNTLNVTAENLLSQMSSLDGSMSTLQQASNTLMTRVQNAEGNLSSLTQTVYGMTLSVTNGTSSSTIKLMQDGVAISSKTIKFTGMVTFTDLSTKGSTVINGSNIKTGIIEGVTFKTVDSNNKLDDIVLSEGKMELGYSTISSAPGVGLRIVDSTSPVYFGSGLSYAMIQGTVVQIKVGNQGKYWEFTTSGIFFKDAQGVQTNQVKLEF